MKWNDGLIDGWMEERKEGSKLIYEWMDEKVSKREWMNEWMNAWN